MIPFMMLLSPLLIRWPKPDGGQSDDDDSGGGGGGGGGGPRRRKPDDPHTGPGGVPLPDAVQSRLRPRSHRLSRGARTPAAADARASSAADPVTQQGADRHQAHKGRIQMWRRATAALIALSAVAALATGSVAGAASSVAYCSLPTYHGTQAWGFHAGAPITKAAGSYAHGRGSLSGTRAGGAICQVDRVAGSPDRQIILSIGHGAVTPAHAVTVGGALGNEMRLPVRVAGSTDPRCKVGTTGTVTLFATYNGIHDDSVRFAFAKACTSHDHVYSGSGVVALVPR